MGLVMQREALIKLCVIRLVYLNKFCDKLL